MTEAARPKKLVPPSAAPADETPDFTPDHGPETPAENLTGEINEPVVLEVTDVLDLHEFRPREVAEIVKTYLEEARKKGFSTVRIIHGKGIGTQREIVRSVLDKTSFVASFEDAPVQAGGWGATIAWLSD